MTHHRIKEKEIGDRDKAGGKRQTAMSPLEIKSEEPIQQKIYGNRSQGHKHRHIAAIKRVKCRRQHLVRRISCEADGVKLKRGRSLSRRFRGEPAMFVNQT